MKTKMSRKIGLIVISLLGSVLITGCSGKEVPTPSDAPTTKQETVNKEDSPEGKTETETEDKEDRTPGKKSLAQRMAGKYSYHFSDKDEYYIMNVVPFGDNLYAFCGQAMPEDGENLEAYTFWASEFIPYDSDEMAGKDNDTVTVNELRFSIMSNLSKYWDSGNKGTITLTDDGLLFKGFDHDDFLAPKVDDSRLFVKDDRVEDAFKYLKRDDKGGDDNLQGFWILDNKGADLYLEFVGSDMYIYKKDPATEVFYAAGGCEYSDGSFECSANLLGQGGMPFELSCEYTVSDDTLTLKITDQDISDAIPANGKYKRVKDGKVHITTMDEVELDSESFGMYGGDQDYAELKTQDYYGVFVSASKESDKCSPVIEKLEEAGFHGSFVVYTPDFSELNPEPYYVATQGLYISESDANEALSELKSAGFKDAYVKYAGSYIGDRYWYTMRGSEKIEELKDGVMLRGVSLTIPYPADGEPVTADLLVSMDAVFDKSADTDSFGNYEKGDTPYEWIIRNHKMMSEDTDQYLMHGPALLGVFEVGLDKSTVTVYYGSYWWD